MAITALNLIEVQIKPVMWGSMQLLRRKKRETSSNLGLQRQAAQEEKKQWIKVKTLQSTVPKVL